ncbi:hypothetical protein D1007_29119 [Hordeum vulgare]|nr:hypothetical protein D1007_29119 [Hordeum vulgare]
MSSPSGVDVGVQRDFDGTCHNHNVHDTPISTRIPDGKDHVVKVGHEVNSPMECSPISVAAHFQVDVGLSFDQSSGHLVLCETQSQSVDGTQDVTQEWMVPNQLRAYELGQCKKKSRFESDSKEYAEKEKQRRVVDGAKGAKFGKFKKRLSFVAEDGGTPRGSPRVACMNKNLGKRDAKACAQDP